jgi:multidrug efflux pump subunit AcrA (membrane-fusion protein)
VAIVKDGNTIALVPVTLGRDFGTSVQILVGLTGDELVVVNPADSLENGQKVRLAQPPPAAKREP